MLISVDKSFVSTTSTAYYVSDDGVCVCVCVCVCVGMCGCDIDWLYCAAKRHLEERPELEDVLVGTSTPPPPLPHTHTHTHTHTPRGGA